MTDRPGPRRGALPLVVLFVAVVALSPPVVLASPATSLPRAGPAGGLPALRPAFVGSTIGTTVAGLAYDPANGWLFASAPAWGSVVVWNTTSKARVANLTVGLRPIGLSFDGLDGDVYVANNGSNNVSVLNASGPRVVGSVPVGTGPFGVWTYDGNDTVFVTNYGSANVSVISGSTQRVLTSIPVLSHPAAINDGIVLHPSRNTATVLDPTTQAVIATYSTGSDPVGESGGYLVNAGSDDVTYVGGTSPLVTVGQDPQALVEDPVDRDLYVANAGSDNLTVVNASLEAAASLPLGQSLGPMAVDAESGTLYVVGGARGVLFAIPPYVDSFTSGLTLPEHPSDLALDPVDDLVAVVNASSAILAVLNLSTGTAGLSVHLAGAPANVTYDARTDAFVASEPGKGRLVVFDAGTGAWKNVGAGLGGVGALAIDNASGAAYVAVPATDRLLDVNLSTGSVAARVAVGAGADVVAYDNATGDVLVLDAAAATVTVVDPATNGVLATLPVGRDPAALALDPVSGEAFVANAGSGNVSEIVGARIVGTVAAGVGPAAVAFDPQNDQVYVANARSRNVSVFSGSTGELTATVRAPVSSEALFDAGDGVVLLASPARVGAIGLDVSRTPVGLVEAFVGGDLAERAIQPASNEMVVNFGNALDAVNATTGALIGPFGQLTQSVRDRTEPQTATVIATDPAHDIDYVAYAAGPVVALNGRTGALIATLPVSNVVGLALDPLAPFLFATTGSVLSIINLTSGRVAHNLSLSGTLLLVDPASGYFYLLGSGSLDVLLLSSRTLIQTLGLPNTPSAGFVSANGSFLDLKASGDVIEAVNVSNLSLAWEVGLGSGSSSGFVVDPVTGDLLTGRPSADQIDVIDPTRGRWVATVPEAEGLVPAGFANTTQPLLAVAPANDAIDWLNATTLAPIRRTVELTGVSATGDELPVETNTDLLLVGGSTFAGGFHFRHAVTVLAQGVTGAVPLLAVQSGLNEAMTLEDNLHCFAHYAGCPVELPLAADPVDPVAVSSLSEVWVADRGARAVSVVHVGRVLPHVVANLSVGPDPDALAYDPVHGLIFVAIGGGANLSVFDASSLAARGTIAVGAGPDALSFDASSGLLYVANGGAATVSVVNTSTLTVVATLSVCSGPTALSPASDGFLAVACAASDTVEAIENGTVGPSVELGRGPLTLAADGPDTVLVYEPALDAARAVFFSV